MERDHSTKQLLFYDSLMVHFDPLACLLRRRYGLITSSVNNTKQFRSFRGAMLDELVNLFDHKSNSSTPTSTNLLVSISNIDSPRRNFYSFFFFFCVKNVWMSKIKNLT